MNPPLKRHPALQAFSKEHHQILLLGFKIRQGLKKDIQAERILEYCSWFVKDYLMPHFEGEELHFGHILDRDSEIYSKLKANHEEVIEHFESVTASYTDLNEFEKHIVAHVRVEERDLFQKIQSQLTPKHILYLESHLKEQNFQERFQDVFWQ